jgi:hypothetical protein
LGSETESILSRRSFSASPVNMSELSEKYLKRMEEKEAASRASKWNAIDKYGEPNSFVLYKNNKFYDKVTVDKLKLAEMK